MKVGDRIYDKFYRKTGVIEKIEEDYCIVKPIIGYDLTHTFKLDLPLLNHTLYKTKFKIGDRIRYIETGKIFKIIGIDELSNYYQTDGNNKDISFNSEYLFERVNKFKVGDLIYLQPGYSGYPESPYEVKIIGDNGFTVKVLTDFGEIETIYISFDEEHKFYKKENKDMLDYGFFNVGDIISHKTFNINDVIIITEITPEFYIGKYKRHDGEIFDGFVIDKSKSDEYKVIGCQDMINESESNNNNENVIEMNNKFNVGDKIYPNSNLNNDILKNGGVVKKIVDNSYIVECKTMDGILITCVIPITECEANYELKYYDKNLKYMPKSPEPVNEKYEKVNHPKHYNSHPSGVECVDIIKYMDTPTGNVIKYCWRLGLKPEEGYTQLEKDLEDAEKARWWIDVKINMIKDELEKQMSK